MEESIAQKRTDQKSMRFQTYGPGRYILAEEIVFGMESRILLETIFVPNKPLERELPKVMALGNVSLKGSETIYLPSFFRVIVLAYRFSQN